MRTLRTLHRWFGAAFALLIILVAVTGILLTHAKELGLNRVMVRMPGYAAAAPVDGTDAVTLRGGVVVAATKAGIFHMKGNDWQRTLAIPARAIAAGSGALYAATVDGLFTSADGRAWTRLATGDYRAVATTPAGVFAASRDNVIAIRNGRAERMASIPQKGADVRRILWTDSGLLLVAKEGVLSVSHGTVKKLALPVENRGGTVELQRIVTDLHTGAFFGTWFVVLADGNAIMLVVLSLTGLWIWWVPLRRRRIVRKAKANEARQPATLGRSFESSPARREHAPGNV